MYLPNSINSGSEYKHSINIIGENLYYFFEFHLIISSKQIHIIFSYFSITLPHY